MCAAGPTPRAGKRTIPPGIAAKALFPLDGFRERPDRLGPILDCGSDYYDQGFPARQDGRGPRRRGPSDVDGLQVGGREPSPRQGHCRADPERVPPTIRKWERWGGGGPIEQLRRKDVREFLDWVHEQAIKDGGTNPGRTANKAREHLRAVLSWAWEQELIERPAVSRPEGAA